MQMNQPMAFFVAHDFTAKWEGGVSNHKADQGGYTSFGVSRAFYEDLLASSKGRQILSSLDLPLVHSGVALVNRSKAESIFYHTFWEPMRLSQVHPGCACLLYDCAVNCGTAASVKLFQRGANAAHNAGLAVDCVLGPLTRAAACNYSSQLVDAVIAARIDYYQAIVKNKKSQAVFLAGWKNRANDLKKYVKEFCAG